MDTMINGWYV